MGALVSTVIPAVTTGLAAGLSDRARQATAPRNDHDAWRRDYQRQLDEYEDAYDERLAEIERREAILARIDREAAAQATAWDNLIDSQAQRVRETRGTTAREREKLRLDSLESEAARERALKRAVARRRAESAARGTGGGASGEAILLGLFEESEEERQQRAQLDQLRQTALDQELQGIQRRNLLERSQLRDQQELDRLSWTF